MSGFLETEKLSVGYDGKPLIRDVCLQVQRGKIVTLIGPNAAGFCAPSSTMCPMCA